MLHMKEFDLKILLKVRERLFTLLNLDQWYSM